MKKYLAYVRVSTKEQNDGASPDAQRIAIKEYAQRNQLTISAWYEEVRTAAKIGRLIFDDMVSQLVNGSADGVIIHKVDRSARNLRDWGKLGDLIDAGVDVRIVHESLDLSTRGGRLTADIQAVVASDFIRNLRQETRKGFYARLKQGGYPLKAPRGYLDTGKGKLKLIDPVTGPIVRAAFELYGTGKYSLYTLAIELARRGLKGSGGRPLTRTSLSRIFHNSFYIGIIHVKTTGETFQGAHEPLVSLKTFNRAQKQMDERTSAQIVRNNFAFRRLLKCDKCGLSLVGEIQKNRVYYRCHGPSCPGVSIREDHVIEDINAFLVSLRLPAKDLQALRDFRDERRDERVMQAKRFQLEQKRLLDLCASRLDRLTDAYLDQALERGIFEQRKAALLIEMRRLQDAIQEINSEDQEDPVLKKLELGNTAYISGDSEFLDDLRSLVEECTSNLIIQEKNTVITPRFPFLEVLNYRKLIDCTQHGTTVRTGGPTCALRTETGRTVWINHSGAVNIYPNSVLELYKFLLKGQESQARRT